MLATFLNKQRSNFTAIPLRETRFVRIDVTESPVGLEIRLAGPHGPPRHHALRGRQRTNLHLLRLPGLPENLAKHLPPDGQACYS